MRGQLRYPPVERTFGSPPRTDQSISPGARDGLASCETLANVESFCVEWQLLDPQRAPAGDTRRLVQSS